MFCGGLPGVGAGSSRRSKRKPGLRRAGMLLVLQLLSLPT